MIRRLATNRNVLFFLVLGFVLLLGVREAPRPERLVEALRQRGKAIHLITTDVRNPSQPLTQKVLRTAAKLGIKHYRLTFWKYAKDKPIPAQLDEIRAELRELAALNQELGLQAGFQNHSGADYVGAPVWDIWQLVRELDPKLVGACFDIGHATLEGGYSWPSTARLMEPHLAAVFVKDFIWKKGEKGWKAEWCPLGEGMVKFAEKYAYGPTRVQFENKDPRGFAQFKKELGEHSALGSANTQIGVQAERPSLYDLVGEMRKLTVPTLVLTGDEDWPCLEPGILMKREIPSAALSVMPNCGHTINLEDPDLFNRIVGDFVGQVEAGRWPRRDPRAISTSITGMKK